MVAAVGSLQVGEQIRGRVQTSQSHFLCLGSAQPHWIASQIPDCRSLLRPTPSWRRLGPTPLGEFCAPTPQARCSTRPTACPLLITRRPHGRLVDKRSVPPPRRRSRSLLHLAISGLHTPCFSALSASSTALLVAPVSPSRTDPHLGWFPIMQDGSRSSKTPRRIAS